MDIIFYIRFMFNKRDKKKRSNVVFSTYFYLFNPVCLTFIGKQRYEFLRYILKITLPVLFCSKSL